jgi:integrase
MPRALRIRKLLNRLGLGMVQINAHTTNRRVFVRREAIVDALVADAQVETLRMLVSGRLSIELLDAHAREHGLAGAGLAAQVATSAPLVAAIEAALPRMGKAAVTRARYETTLAKLRRVYPVADQLLVRDLVRIDWQALRVDWRGSASDWMHLRRLVSRFLSIHLGSKIHPFRAEVVELIPTEVEEERVPELTPAQFRRLVSHVREDIQPALWTLLLTGMRVGEYLRCDVTHLVPTLHAIKVPGTKTRGSQAQVRVAPSMWHYIEAAIPAPVQYKWLRLHFKAGLKAAKLPSTIRLHDLRHAHGQWAVEAGVPEALVQVSLRHSNAAMTRRYTKSAGKAAVADGLAKTMTEEV